MTTYLIVDYSGRDINCITIYDNLYSQKYMVQLGVRGGIDSLYLTLYIY
jgi:hypothetical protein